MNEAAEILDVLVVGAGFAGLSAARTLADEGVRFRVVDSFGDHLGGRALSYASPQPAGTTLRFDHGAQYVGDLQNEIMGHIRDLLPPDTLINGAQLRKPYDYEVMVLGGERMLFKASDAVLGIPGVPPQLGIRGALEMVAVLAEMTIIEWRIDVVEPWKGSESLLELDQISCWDWIKSKSWVSDTVADLLRISVEALLSVEPTEISPYYLLWYTACNEGFLNEINDNEGGPQQYWLRRGCEELADALAEPVKDHVQSGSAVTAIDLSGDVVKATMADGSEIQAKKVLLAVSPSTVGRRIQFTPEPSEARKKLLAEPMGRTLKCQAFYKTDWWHDANGGYDFDGYVGGANYPVLWVMDNSPPEAREDGGPNVLMTFTVGAQLDALGDEPTPEVIEKFVTDALAILFDDERAKCTSDEFIEMKSFLWNRSEKNVGGGPNTVFTPGMLTGEPGRLLNEPWDDKVYFASAENSLNAAPQSERTCWYPFMSERLPEYGEDGVRLDEPAPPYHSRYSDRRKSLGYMDGALHSGRYAALQIASDLKGQPLPVTAAHEDEPYEVPEEKPQALDSVAAVLSGFRSAIDDISLDDLDVFGKQEVAAGRRGMTSWVRDKLLELLQGHGHFAADAHPIDQLSTMRDFVVSLLETLPSGGDGEADVEDDDPQRGGIVAEFAALEERIAALFDD